jgi:hypothetical protein
MRQETKTVFIADDGKEFENSEEAAAHDILVAKRVLNRTFWKVIYVSDMMFPDDLNEEWFEIILEDKSLAKEFFEDYCHERHGYKIAFKNGVEPIVVWAITKLDPKDFASVEELSDMCRKLELGQEKESRLKLVE